MLPSVIGGPEIVVGCSCREDTASAGPSLPGVAAANRGGLSVVPARFQYPPQTQSLEERHGETSADGFFARRPPRPLTGWRGTPGSRGSGSAVDAVRRASKF
jgi:hypothetical protein